MSSKKERVQDKSKELARLKLLKSSGKWNAGSFVWENMLFNKAYVKKRLDHRIKHCCKCELNEKSITESAPGYGNLNADIFFVGQSLCTQCMRTQIPFTEGSGYYIDAALRLSGLRRNDVFITNVVHCHPPGNRSSTKHEIALCREYLISELILVRPKLVVLLGADAGRFMDEIDSKYADIANKFCAFKVKHPASFAYNGFKGAEKWIIDLSMEIDKYLERNML